ncbi:MAG TPA: NADP-dependent oxidoreductase [Kofleriaceae bacterium]|nr:NADP-dependent oxidoreductase [Kofleriaceae bacterium]
MVRKNHRFTLAARPTGMPKPSDFAFEEEDLREPGAGELVVAVRYISLDPAMRGWMNEGKSYVPPVKIGEVMRAFAIGQVVESNHARFAVGDHVSGLFGVQEYALSKGNDLMRVDPRIAPLPVMLSTLGMPGLTAYFGLLEIGKPVAGNTVVVSGAAGAVGSVVGQIAKLKGCRAVGIAGGPDKCRYLTEIGFDAAIDYKAVDVKAALREHCPSGIDIYFDNVGGDILDAALSQLALHARVVICGAISQYNNTTAIKGPSNYLSLLVNRASMTGMVVMDFTPKFATAIAEMAQWMAAGKLRSREDIVRGLETFPHTLLKLFTGENHGKLVLEVAAEGR